MGPQARAAVDQAQAATLQSIAALLRPGVTLHIERTRPTWCAGWCENFTIEPGEDLAGLYEHVKAEWGGGRYRIFVLGGGNSELGLEGSIAIAGEPRHEGRPLVRDTEPISSSSARGANPAPAAGGIETMFPVVAGVLKMFFDQQERVSTAQLTAIRDTQQAQRDQTTALVNAALERRERETETARPPSFAQQVNELAGAFQTMQRAQRLFGSAAPKRKSDDDDDNRGALHEMSKQFMGAAMASFFGGGNAGGAQRPAAARPVRVRPVTNAQPHPAPSSRNGSGSIPDAVPQSGPQKPAARN